MKWTKHYRCIINLFSDRTSCIVAPRPKWKPTVTKRPKSASEGAEKLCAGRGPWRLSLLSRFPSSSFWKLFLIPEELQTHIQDPNDWSACLFPQNSLLVFRYFPLLFSNCLDIILKYFTVSLLCPSKFVIHKHPYIPRQIKTLKTKRVCFM